MEEVTQHQRAQEIIARMRVYTGLWADGRFQEWRKKVVEGRLEQWQKAVMSGQVPREEIEANILAYQKVRGMFDEFFNAMQTNEEEARKITNVPS